MKISAVVHFKLIRYWLVLQLRRAYSVYLRLCVACARGFQPCSLIILVILHSGIEAFE